MPGNRIVVPLCAALLAAAAVAAAQPAPAPPPSQSPSLSSLDGAWTARIKLLNGRELEARLNLQRDAGTWRVIFQNTGDPCVGLPWPVAVRRLDDSNFEFQFLGSRALTGCADSAMVFRRVNENTLQGRSQTGLDITATRP